MGVAGAATTMPVIVTPPPALPLRRYASRVPLWRRLVALADQAVARFRLLWQRLFLDARQALHQRPLMQALDVHLLEGRSYVQQVWERTVEQPARRLLPIFGMDLMEEAATTMQVSLATTADVVHQLDLYVGRQVLGITETTRQALQQVLREGFQAGHAPLRLAREIRDMLGLTPRQVQTLNRLRVQLATQGATAREIAQRMQQATQQALQQRAKVIAQTESVALTQAGAQAVFVQQLQSGQLDPTTRRYWQVVAGACEDCVALAQTYAEGVGIAEPFGDVMTPPLHPRCRCSVTLQRPSE